MSELFSSAYINQYPERVADAMELGGEYAAEYDLEPAVGRIEGDDAVRIESIYAIQALAMASLRPLARTRLRRSQPVRRYGFSILHDQEPESTDPYDGASESYMSWVLTKQNFVDWSMRVRFRQNVRTEAQRNQSTLEDYTFAWRRGGDVALAAYALHNDQTDGYTSNHTYLQLRPLTDSDVQTLRDRMQQHGDQVTTQLPEGSIYRAEVA